MAESEKVKQLELALAEKESELQRYKSELGKLNVQLRDLITQISGEIKTAHTIQKILVPTELPSIPGFEISNKFLASFVSGGDYFDVFEHDDRMRFGLLLSSSSGHGMSALFLSVLMKVAGQMEARKGLDPAQAIASIVGQLKDQLQSHDLADVFYGVIDRRTFELQYILMGDVLALQYNRQENGIVRLPSLTAPISPVFGEPLVHKSISLNARDRVVLVSRGVFESKDADGEKFGVKRIEACVFAKKDANVHELRNEILFQAQQFSGKAEPDRDQTVIVLEVKDNVLKLAKN